MIVYEKQTCSKCSALNKFLDERNISYEIIDYYKTPLSKKVLEGILSKLKITAKDLMRTKENVYVSLHIDTGEYEEDELIELMIKKPDLMQRPIGVTKKGAIVARPVEKIEEIL